MDRLQKNVLVRSIMMYGMQCLRCNRNTSLSYKNPGTQLVLNAIFTPITLVQDEPSKALPTQQKAMAKKNARVSIAAIVMLTGMLFPCWLFPHLLTVAAALPPQAIVAEVGAVVTPVAEVPAAVGN